MQILGLTRMNVLVTRIGVDLGSAHLASLIMGVCLEATDGQMLAVSGHYIYFSSPEPKARI